jgi:uncharacterized protein (DUF1501 family)
MNRRDLLKLFALAPFLWHAPALAAKRWARTLVLVELKGGNDGLNTLVPFTDPLYYKLRPRLALNPKSVLPIDKNWGLNGAMEALQPAWYAYEMAVIHGVGYENPDRSHFRSIGIWDTASDSDDYLRDGWLARQFAAAWPRTGYVADAIQMGPGDAGPLAGPDMRVLVLDDPATILRKGKRGSAAATGGANPALAHILKEREKLGDGPEVLNLPMIEVPESFPRTQFAQRLGEIVRHMESENAAPVYKVTLPGFDTHHNQRAQHDRLLRELAEGLAAFRNALNDDGLWSRTLVLTYSEFGRHVAENATGGTDHGTCAPHFMLGGGVLGGLYGQPPALADLEQGDLRFTTDFRRLYATVVEGWWGMRQAFLPNRRFDPIPCLRGG